MVSINGKEYGFMYTVAAYLDYQDYIVANPDTSWAHGQLQLACLMNREYNRANGIKNNDLKLTDLRSLTVGAANIDGILKEVEIQIKVDSEVTVEAKPGKEEAGVKES